MSVRPWPLIAALGLAACAGNSLGLSGAGSMRVEVEVYKGPLANDTPIQIGELRTVIEETARTLFVWYQGVQEARKETLPCGRRDCLAIAEAEAAAKEIVGKICRLADYVASPPPKRTAYQKCIDSDIDDTYRHIDQLSMRNIVMDQTNLLANQEQVARRLSQLAGDMKAKGFRVAYHLVSYVPRDRTVRTLLANFNLIVSEYSNQIQARVGVLDKQFTALRRDDTGGGYGAGRRKMLPVGDYLRDASPTDMIHLFEWFNAGDARLDTPGQLTLDERVRMAERLFGDYYWERINEVYTSGQGDVSMAFIKNDIGNWDLKSFSNDPAELVGAYRQAANAAISAIADVASGGTTKGVKAGEQLLDLGNRIATGESRLAPNLGVLDASALHGRALSKLSTRRASYAEAEAKLLEVKTAADQAVTGAEGEVKTKAGEVAARQTTFDAADRQAIDCQTQHPSDADIQCAGVIGARETARGGLASAQTAKTAADADLDGKKHAAEKAASDLTALRKAAQADIREILDDHLALIAMLQDAVAGSTEPTTPTAAAAAPTVTGSAAPALGQGLP